MRQQHHRCRSLPQSHDAMRSRYQQSHDAMRTRYEQSQAAVGRTTTLSPPSVSENKRFLLYRFLQQSARRFFHQRISEQRTPPGAQPLEFSPLRLLTLRVFSLICWISLFSLSCHLKWSGCWPMSINLWKEFVLPLFFSSLPHSFRSLFMTSIQKPFRKFSLNDFSRSDSCPRKTRKTLSSWMIGF